MGSLRNRLLIIGAIIVAAVWALLPRTVIERTKRDGVFVYDTVRRVPLKRGLDLVGGMYLALEIDESKGAVADKADALDRAIKVVRTRIDEFGVAEPNVQKAGDSRIIVELPGIDDPRRAEELISQQAYLEFMITDETRALERTLPRLDQIVREQGAAAGGETPVASGDTAQKSSLQQLFVPKDSGAVATDSTGQDSAAAPGAMATGGPLSSIIQVGSMPGEYLVAEKDVPRAEHYLSLPPVVQALPPGKVIRWGNEPIPLGGDVYRPFYVLDARPIITGDYIQDAVPNQDPIEGTIVQFELNNEGGRRFRTETGRHIQDYMAIVLTNRVMGRPPVIQGAIGTRGQITLGGRDLQAAQDLALVLRAGALPVPLTIVEARNIGASLGADAVRQGLMAGALGVVLVILIMIGYYRFSGMLAVLGLMFYGLTTLAVLAGFNAVLTLPGIAGFVLSIGMAVDANFLIFERIREELDRGKTVRTAINEGFDHAWSAIVDTHVTTALTAAILYQFGTGPVRGFAVALLAGLAASLVSAIFVVRTLFYVWLNRSQGARTLSI
jgi:preprotein translocase subunit SecD